MVYSLIQKLLSASSSAQPQFTPTLSVVPLTPRTWLSAVGDVPRLVQLLDSTSITQTRALAVQQLLQHISNYHEEGCGGEAAPDGVIPPLVSMLQSHGNAFVGRMAVLTLSTLALNAGNQHKILEAGAAVPLVQLMQSDWQGMQSAAMLALVNLCRSSEACQARIVAAGAIAPLVQLLGADGSDEELQEQAVKVLANLTSSDAQAAVNAGAIPLLVERLTAGSAESHASAASALQTIAEDVDTHVAILAAAPLLPLVQLLTSGSAAAKHDSYMVLVHLVNAPTLPEKFIAAGAVPPLVHVLRSESAWDQEAAVSLLGLLAETGRADIFAAIKSAGALPLLARLQLAAGNETLRDDAGLLLEDLMGTSLYDNLCSTSALSSATASVHPTSTAGPPSTAAAASLPAATSPQQQLLTPRPRKSCWSCGATGVPLKKCSVCAVATYCGAGCQKADWKAHKGQCAGLKAGASGSGSSTTVGET